MKTILVDNEPLMQQKLETVMKDIREVDVVGSFGNSEKALEYAKEQGCNVEGICGGIIK